MLSHFLLCTDITQCSDIVIQVSRSSVVESFLVIRLSYLSTSVRWVLILLFCIYLSLTENYFFLTNNVATKILTQISLNFCKRMCQTDANCWSSLYIQISSIRCLPPPAVCESHLYLVCICFVDPRLCVLFASELISSLRLKEKKTRNSKSKLPLFKKKLWCKKRLKWRSSRPLLKLSCLWKQYKETGLKKIDSQRLKRMNVKGKCCR